MAEQSWAVPPGAGGTGHGPEPCPRVLRQRGHLLSSCHGGQVTGEAPVKAGRQADSLYLKRKKSFLTAVKLCETKDGTGS